MSGPLIFCLETIGMASFADVSLHQSFLSNHCCGS